MTTGSTLHAQYENIVHSIIKEQPTQPDPLIVTPLTPALVGTLAANVFNVHPLTAMTSYFAVKGLINHCRILQAMPDLSNQSMNRQRKEAGQTLISDEKQALSFIRKYYESQIELNGYSSLRKIMTAYAIYTLATFRDLPCKCEQSGLISVMKQSIVPMSVACLSFSLVSAISSLYQDREEDLKLFQRAYLDKGEQIEEGEKEKKLVREGLQGRIHGQILQKDWEIQTQGAPARDGGYMWTLYQLGMSLGTGVAISSYLDREITPLPIAIANYSLWRMIDYYKDYKTQRKLHYVLEKVPESENVHLHRACQRQIEYHQRKWRNIGYWMALMGCIYSRCSLPEDSQHFGSPVRAAIDVLIASLAGVIFCRFWKRAPALRP